MSNLLTAFPHLLENGCFLVRSYTYF